MISLRAFGNYEEIIQQTTFWAPLFCHEFFRCGAVEKLEVFDSHVIVSCCWPSYHVVLCPGPLPPRQKLLYPQKWNYKKSLYGRWQAQYHFCRSGLISPPLMSSTFGFSSSETSWAQRGHPWPLCTPPVRFIRSIEPLFYNRSGFSQVLNLNPPETS